MTFAIQQASPFGAFRESPLHARGGGEILLFVSLDNGTVHRINPSDGTSIWSQTLASSGRMAISSGRRLFVERGASGISELDIDDGTVLSTQALTNHSICIGSNGAIYTYGRTSGAPDGVTSRGFDIATENWKYAVSYGFEQIIPVGSSGEIYLATNISRNTIGANNALFKIDSSGSLVWGVHYDYDVAGTFNQHAPDIDIYGDYIFLCLYNDDAGFGAGKGEYIQRRNRSDGSHSASTFIAASGGIFTGLNGNGVRVANSGKVYTTHQNGWKVRCYDQSLTLLTDFVLGFAGGRGIDVDSSGNVYVAGYRSNTWTGATGYAHLWKLDEDLNVLWTRDFGAGVTNAYRVCCNYHSPR